MYILQYRIMIDSTAIIAYLSQYSIPILTFFLVLITGYYAWETRSMVKEMEKTRKNQFIPYLKIKPTRLYLGDGFEIEIKNIGVGVAKNIRGTISLIPDGGQKEVVYPILFPRERFVLQEPFERARTYESARSYREIKLSVNYMDISDNIHTQEDIFLIDDLNRIRNDDYSRNKVADELRDIGRKLDDIKSAIQSHR